MEILPNEMFLEIIYNIPSLDLLKKCCLISKKWNNHIKFLPESYWRMQFESECLNLFNSYLSDKSELDAYDYKDNNFLKHWKISCDINTISEILKKAKIVVVFSNKTLHNLIFFDSRYAYIQYYKDFYKKVKDIHDTNFTYWTSIFKIQIPAKISSHVNYKYLLHMTNSGFIKAGQFKYYKNDYRDIIRIKFSNFDTKSRDEFFEIKNSPDPEEFNQTVCIKKYKYVYLISFYN
jgi:hypothetical protein